ncbi:MAG: EutN/CcmL family microcompartment protein [Pirellulales bacterium]|nr:EutN/CcmL family microcompartment protein [Pirellulales bacterium]
MQTGTVIGTATATVKHPSLVGAKLLVVNIEMADGRASDGNPLLVVDWLGAGRGDRVLITSDGPAVQEHLKDDKTPVRYSVVGIVDP